MVKIRLLGTILQKYWTDQPKSKNCKISKYAALILADYSGKTIQIQCWKYGDSESQPMKVIERVEVGDLIDLIGSIREYNGMKYVTPELIKKSTVLQDLQRRNKKILLNH